MKRLSPIVATVALVALAFAAACSSAPAATLTPGQTPAKTAIPATSGPTATPRPTTAPTSGPTSAVQPTATPAAQGLTLTIVQPQIEAVVTGSLLEVKGQTAPDAIVSVNGIIVKSVDAGGNFTAVVQLEEGPNLVEIVASDYQNNQVSQTLAVIYAP